MPTCNIYNEYFKEGAATNGRLDCKQSLFFICRPSNLESSKDKPIASSCSQGHLRWPLYDQAWCGDDKTISHESEKEVFSNKCSLKDESSR